MTINYASVAQLLDAKSDNFWQFFIFENKNKKCNLLYMAWMLNNVAIFFRQI